MLDREEAVSEAEQLSPANDGAGIWTQARSLSPLSTVPEMGQHGRDGPRARVLSQACPRDHRSPQLWQNPCTPHYC